MIWIPGWLINAVTFPGIIVRMLSIHMLCDITKTEVYNVNYLRGRIAHGPITSTGRATLIVFAPLLINTLLCIIFMFPYASVFMLGSETEPPGVALFWLGLATGMHAFPSKEFSQHLWDSVSVPSKSRIVHGIHVLLMGVFSIVNFLKRLWFDAFYAFGIGIMVPRLLIELFSVS